LPAWLHRSKPAPVTYRGTANTGVIRVGLLRGQRHACA